MSDPRQWLFDLSTTSDMPVVDGLVSVDGFKNRGKTPEEIIAIEKASQYGATAVFFEAGHNNSPPVPQAFVFVSDGPADEPAFAQTHKRLWSWGGVPLIYRVTTGLVQLFRCAHRADFESNGRVALKPYKTLNLAAAIATDPWWDAERIRNGTLWDDPKVCKSLLSGELASQKSLITEFKLLHDDLNSQGVLPKHLRRKLLILSLLIAYLEERKVFKPEFFGKFLDGASKFFEVLASGPALIELLEHLQERFNGNVFVIADADKERLKTSGQLGKFARFVEAKQESTGQLSLWQKYSFADLPVEVISHIYQLFVKDSASSVYTPPFLVRLMLSEILSWEQLDRLIENDEIVLDPACGSGVFLIETYKRLVVHWRSRNEWKKPTKAVLQRLVKRIHGIDLEDGAVELAAFSLCLGLCDALEPSEIRSSIRLFPELIGKTIHESCFFKAKEEKVIKKKVGIVVGNPPFVSKLTTQGAKNSYDRYQDSHGPLPDKQLAYLFLHDSMEMLEPGGVLCMLQQYNFLYNQQSLEFRQKFIQRWNVREILDFISIRGLFKKGTKDTKVLVVAAEANEPSEDQKILHATFRRTGRVVAERGFEIDYYDMHWLSRELVLTHDHVWRCDLLGGGKVQALVTRLNAFSTLENYARDNKWDIGEGFIEAKPPTDGPASKTVVRNPAPHVTGKPLLPSNGIKATGIDRESIGKVQTELFRSAYTKARYTPPMVLIHEQANLNHDFWDEHYLTYKNQIVGVCGLKNDSKKVKKLAKYIERNKRALQAYVACTSVKMFTQHATTLSATDIFNLPYPAESKLDLSEFEKILIDDIVDFGRDHVRLGEKSTVSILSGSDGLSAFNETFTNSINAIYKKNPLRFLEPVIWPGVICQPYMFGSGTIDWDGVEQLQTKLDGLLKEEKGAGLKITRIARIYDGNCIFLLKPNTLRYWLRSIALRDADETLADLWDQGF